MKKVYKAHILFTKERAKFEVVEKGYIAVEDGKVTGVYEQLPDELKGVAVADFGDKLLIPAMNDMHVHAPQYRNQGIAMDLELLPWLQNYTFPEESKYVDARSLLIHSLMNFAAVTLASPRIRYSGCVDTSTSTPLL